jgi:diacylglycerol kinase (ATP)
MRHVFIVNNKAGNGRASIEIVPRIEAYFAREGGAFEIVNTSRKGDATEIARREALSGDEVRIYACGGDGTLSEVANGVCGYPNVEVGAIPCGTGNDYISTFGRKEDFLDIEGQVKGSSVEVDLIDVDGIYAVNQCSAGFDAAVVANAQKFKSKPVIGGGMSYVTSVFYTLFSHLGSRMTVQMDDEQMQGEFLFAVAAKGMYQGGGLKNAPLADPKNRMLSCGVVKKVSRAKFLRLFPKYIKGRHIDYTDVVYTKYAKYMRITAPKPLPITLDGEMIYSEDIEVRIVEKGMRFVLPRVCAEKHRERVDSRLSQSVKIPSLDGQRQNVSSARR